MNRSRSRSRTLRCNLQSSTSLSVRERATPPAAQRAARVAPPASCVFATPRITKALSAPRRAPRPRRSPCARAHARFVPHHPPTHQSAHTRGSPAPPPSRSPRLSALFGAAAAGDYDGRMSSSDKLGEVDLDLSPIQEGELVDVELPLDTQGSLTVTRRRTPLPPNCSRGLSTAHLPGLPHGDPPPRRNPPTSPFPRPLA
eukprot:6090992-Prymnesium_polylepis.1